MIVSFMSNKKNIFFSLIILIAVDIIIVLSGERTAIVLSLIGTIGIIILINKYKLIRLIALVIAILLSFIIIYNDDNVKERVITSTINELDLFEENKHLFSEGHELYYWTSYNMFLDHKIFGIGPKNYRILCNDPRYFKLIQTEDNLNNTCSTHPHNTYAQLLAETGIMGILPVIFLFFFIVSLLFRHFVSMIFVSDKNRLTDYQICLLISVFLTLWPLVPTLNFFNNWISIIYFLPVGFLLQAFDKNTNN
jgi:O-antigen ligase